MLLHLKLFISFWVFWCKHSIYRIKGVYLLWLNLSILLLLINKDLASCGVLSYQQNLHKMYFSNQMNGIHTYNGNMQKETACWFIISFTHPPLLTHKYLTIIAKIITTTAINTYFNGTVSSYGTGFTSSLATFPAGFVSGSCFDWVLLLGYS